MLIPIVPPKKNAENASPVTYKRGKRLIIKNPFWAGFLVGLCAFWLGGMISALPVLWGVATNSSLITLLGTLAGIAIGVAAIVYANRVRLRNGFTALPASGVAMGVVAYFLLAFLLVMSVYRP
jgi:hypothetical protein